MSQIYDFTNPFKFDSVTLGTPTSRNGSYFMKLTTDDEPVYIQMPKSTIKQGFFKSGKKTYCDLVFSNENEKLMSWLESFEAVCLTTICDNKTKWFETEFEKEEIESMLTPPYKMYKSGKFFIIRAFVPTTLGKYDLKVYDENENEIEVDNVPDDSNVIVILEFSGIKSALRNFQFEIEIKQMLIVKPAIKFEKCIIHRNSTNDQHSSSEKNSDISKSSPSTNKEDADENNLANLKESDKPEITDSSPNSPKSSLESNKLHALGINIEEVTLNLEEIKEDPVCLKNRNEIYYKMYKDAKKKAREAKLLALSNYLEAKRIKDTYMLEDNSDDESEEDLSKIFSK